MMEYVNSLILENAELRIRLEEAQNRIVNFESSLGSQVLIQRVSDQKRREMVMAAAEEIQAQGISLQPIPYPDHSDLVGLSLSSLARSGLIRGSIAWLSRNAKSGNVPHYRFKKDVWFDALDIKEVQEFELKPTRAGKRRSVGYKRGQRAT